jgi:hypothetical protein
VDTLGFDNTYYRPREARHTRAFSNARRGKTLT